MFMNGVYNFVGVHVGYIFGGLFFLGILSILYPPRVKTDSEKKIRGWILSIGLVGFLLLSALAIQGS